MKKFNTSRYLSFALASALMVGSAMAEGEFDPSSAATSAEASVRLIATALGGLLTAAVVIYVSFLGYRKVKEGLAKA